MEKFLVFYYITLVKFNNTVSNFDDFIDKHGGESGGIVIYNSDLRSSSQKNIARSVSPNLK